MRKKIIKILTEFSVFVVLTIIAKGICIYFNLGNDGCFTAGLIVAIIFLGIFEERK